MSEMTYRSPTRLSVLDRARNVFGDTYHKRPADYMKYQMRQAYEFKFNATALGAVDIKSQYIPE